MMTNYRRGADFERKVLKHLQLKDYYAIRSAGSHQAVDIVAIGRGGISPTILFVQCKTGGAISAGDWNELYTTATRYRAKPLLAQVGKRGEGPLFHEILSPKLPGGGGLYRKRVTNGGESEIFVP